jgi:tetratricopeptide (TPR) repeat protein
MNRTALIPLSLFLVVIVIATVTVSYYETVFSSRHNIIHRDKTIDIYKNYYTLKSRENIVWDRHFPVGKNIKIFQKSLDIPSLHISMLQAKKLISVGKFDEAENLIKTVLVFYPKNIEALSLLTGIYCFSGKYNLSDDLLRKILVIDPDNFAAQENLGIVLEKQKNYTCALASFLRASLMKPESPLAYIHMAKINSILGNKKEAMDNFAKAYELLGYRIYPFTFISAFDNLRDIPLFIEIVEKSKLQNYNENDKTLDDYVDHKEISNKK